MKFRSFLFALPILFFLQNCKKMPNGGVPIYLKIDSVLVSSTLDQGSASHKITDVWVTANGENRGVYPLPAKIPILASGDVRMIVSAGIRDNGISSTRAEYPFYNVDEFTINGTEGGKTYTRNSVFTYLDGTKFAFKEDFEASNAYSNMTRITSGTDANVFEGSAAGKLTLGPNDTVVVAYNTNGFPITGAGREVYLEVNYKSDAFFEVGLITTKAGLLGNYYKMTISPKEEWNKIYINLSNEAGTILADDYRLYFKIAKLADGTTATTYLDNIKVVQF
jgi:hypothetical protein